MHRYRNINLFQWSGYENNIHIEENNANPWVQSFFNIIFPVSFDQPFVYITNMTIGGTLDEWVGVAISNQLAYDQAHPLLHTYYLPDTTASICYIALGCY